MGKMTIYLSCEDNEALASWTKKIYLLEADKRMELGVFKDIKECDGEPDFVLHIQPQPNTDRRGNKWTGLWHIDVGDESYFTTRYSNFDTVFLASSSSLVKGDNTRLLFQAADPVVHKRIPHIKQEYDFVLCGGIESLDRHKERERRYRLMKEYFSFESYGKGFPPHEFIQKYNTAKVQFIQSAVSPKGEGMCAQRFFECLAIGPVLANWCPDLEHVGLVEGEDYLAYRNDEEMFAKMRLLLEDPAYREKIAKNGRQKSLMYHTYDQRATAIMNIAREFI